MNAAWEWWMLPLSGSDNSAIAPAVYWHGRLMVLAWGVLVPLGVLVARYFKVVPGQNWPDHLDHKFWWHAHRSLQWLSVLLATFGLLLVVPQATSTAPLAQTHSVLGWSLMVLAGMQVLSGLLRGSKGGPSEPVLRGDHYDMSPRRVWFERVHKSLGWLLVAASVIALNAGLVLADAPRWMPALLVVWWLALTAWALRWQAQGRCISTYQSIWGLDSEHPGNQGLHMGSSTQRHKKGPYEPS